MTVQCLNGFSHKICIAHYRLLFELEVQRVEIVDVLIIGESWRDHNKKNEKLSSSGPLALIRFAARLHIIELSHTVRAEPLVRAFARADGLRNADFDRARPIGADLFVHSFRCQPEDGGPEIIHKHQSFRDHGDPFLYPGGKLSHRR
jgi:hypothetical protein